MIANETNGEERAGVSATLRQQITEQKNKDTHPRPISFIVIGNIFLYA